jgi:RimJ/RimL family protein N-acetyltransferase
VLRLLNSEGFLANIGDRGVHTIEDAEGYLQTAPIFAYGPEGLGFNVVEVLETGEPVGTCGLVKREALKHPDVGYALIDEAAGRGYATEAAAATLRHARETLRLERVLAITSLENTSSQRVLEKIGMRYEGLVDVPGYDGPSRLYAAP